MAWSKEDGFDYSRKGSPLEDQKDQVGDRSSRRSSITVVTKKWPSFDGVWFDQSGINLSRSGNRCLVGGLQLFLAETSHAKWLLHTVFSMVPKAQSNKKKFSRFHECLQLIWFLSVLTDFLSCQWRNPGFYPARKPDPARTGRHFPSTWIELR